MARKIYLAPNLNIYEPTVLIDPYTGIANHSISLDKWISDAIADGTIPVTAGAVTFTASHSAGNLTMTVGGTTVIVPIPDLDTQSLSLFGNQLSISNGNTLSLNISNIKLTNPVTINGTNLTSANTLEELISLLNNINTYAYYIHTQTTPSNIWTISTGLNRPCAVTITDSAGTVVYGEIIRSNVNLGDYTLVFSVPFAGIATFN